MNQAKKALVVLLKKLDLGSAVAVRLTKLTGKSKVPIHPKHFLSQKPWFIKHITKDDVILDLGSGNGQNAIKASKFCKRIVGTEIDKNLIKIAEASKENNRVKNIKFDLVDLEKKLKYHSNSFDKILFLDVLEHLRNRDQILREVRRILKPRGILFLGVPNSQTSWKKLQRSAGVCSFSDPDHKIEFSEKTISDLLEKHHLTVLELNYGKFDTPLRGLFDVVGAISLDLYKKINYWRQRKVLSNPAEASGFEIIARNDK